MSGSYWGQIEYFEGGIIRVFADGAVYGEPYDYAIPFKRIDEDTVEVVGAIRNEHGQNNIPRPHQWRAMKQAFKEAGLKVIFNRKGGAEPGSHVAVS